MIEYIHGSADSTDVDVLYVVDEPLERSEATKLCSDNSKVNKNVICIKDGVVVWVYKGTPDEVNNALVDTYDLHTQQHPLVVTRRVLRQIPLKAMRVMRGIVSHCSRTEMRPEVKRVLRSPEWQDRIDFVRVNDLHLREDYGRHDVIEIRKFFAFQLGQLRGLLEGKELYTKTDVAETYPELKDMLYRINGADPINLQPSWDIFLDYVDSKYCHVYAETVEVNKI